MIILFLLFITLSLKSVTPNHHIALNHYVQAMNLSNKDKEYLENAGVIIADAIKKVDSKDESENQEREPVFDPESFAEFDFISKKGEGLFFPKNAQLSHAGTAFIAYLSTAQTIDRTVLEKRSYILSYLEKNPEFKAELIKVMRALNSEKEESLLELGWLLSEKEKEDQNDFFFSRSNLVLPDFITKRVIPQSFVNWYANYFSKHSNLFAFLNVISHPVSYNFFSTVILRFLVKESSPYDPLIGAIRLNKDVFSEIKFGASVSDKIEGCIVVIGAQAFLSMGIIYSCFKAVKDYNKKFLKRERLFVGAQKTVQACRKLDELLVKHPEFSKHLLLKDTLQITTKTQGLDGDSCFVLNQLNNNQITRPSFLNYWLWGDRIVVNKILVHNPEIIRQHIFPALAALGELDAYCALADQFRNYSVPQFVDKGVSFSLAGFFHPNLRDPVCNDLDLSKTGKRKVCVSGGNGSGKSAITRSVIGSLVVAQTFNRISAQSSKIPLFDKIAIFANLSDNLGVASKFQVELAKLKKLQEYLEKNPNKKVLLMLDEPLTSTNTELVGKILFDLFGLLSKYQNLMIFCVSNTPGLKDFQDVVHMGTIVKTNSDGTFKPTYHWKEGSAYVSDVWYQFRKIFGKDFGTSARAVTD